MARNERKKIRLPMEMEIEMKPISKIKIQVLGTGISQNSPPMDQAQTKINLDEISQVEDQEAVQAPLHFDFVSLPHFFHDAERRYTKQDLKYNFAVIYFTAWIKMSPLGVDKSSKNHPQVRVAHKIWWKNMICFGWFLLAVIRLFSLIFSTAQLVQSGDAEKELGRITLMMCLTAIFTLLIYSLFDTMHETINHCMVLDNSLFKYLDDEPAEKSKSPENGSYSSNWLWKLGIGSHSPKELLIIYLPFFVFSLCGMIPLMSVFDPSFPLLLVSLLPPASRFSLGFFCVVVFDSIIVTYYIMIIHMVFYLFFCMHRMQEEAKLTIKNMNMNMEREANKSSVLNRASVETRDRDAEKIERALKSLRLLHTWTQYFNLSFSTTVYSGKLVALSGSILGGFGFIKMMEAENWPYATVFGLLFLEGVTLYNICFGGAYEIPETVQELKLQVRQLSYRIKSDSVSKLGARSSNQHQNVNRKRDEKKYTEKVLRSVPWLGVKDGVYKMERMTCVNFLQFATDQITGLVLAY